MDRYKLSVLLIFLFFFACSYEVKVDNKLTTPLNDDHVKVVGFYDLFKTDTLELAATDSTLLFDMYFSFMVTDDKIYVSNSIGGVFADMYDITGKYIKRIARKGSGPREVLTPGKFVMMNDMIVIPDGSGLNMKCFDLNGNYLFQENFTTVGFKDIASNNRNTIVLYHGQPGYQHPLTIYNTDTKQKIKVGEYNLINRAQIIFDVRGVCFDSNNYFYVIYAKEGTVYRYTIDGKMDMSFTIPEHYFYVQNSRELLNLKERDDEDNYGKYYFSSPRITGIFSFSDTLLVVQIEETVKNFQRPNGKELLYNLIIFSSNGTLLYSVENIPYSQKIINSDGKFLYGVKSINKSDSENILNPAIIRYRLKDRT